MPAANRSRDTDRYALLSKGLLLGWLLVVFAATLQPGGAEDSLGSVTCLVCGTRGLADAILNVALFVPLGLALALTLERPAAALLLAALLSAGIELAQVVLPGRHPTLGDLVFNTTGALLGICVARSWSFWLVPAPSPAGRLSLGGSGGALVILGLTGFLLGPSLPRSLYFGQWTPDLGHLERYRGKVSEFTIGPVAIPPRRLAESDSVRALLSVGAPIHVEAIAGPPIERLGPLVSVYDDLHREILLIGPDRGDLVYRYRTRAASLRLDQPDLRLYGAMGRIEPGDRLQVTLSHGHDGRCLSLNGTGKCGIGFGVGSGWATLYYPEIASRSLAGALNALWLALLCLPGAFWSTGGRLLARHGLLLVAGFVVIPMFSGLSSVSAVEVLGAAAGVSLGFGLQRLLRSRLVPDAGRGMRWSP
ncbi:MAG: VanZ family protein [Gemmatimonadota bacterium]|nr:MAG: VanZ family protein [Gemmatimonadota bacterium]